MASETESLSDKLPWSDGYAGGSQQGSQQEGGDDDHDSNQGDPNHSWIKTPLFVTSEFC